LDPPFPKVEKGSLKKKIKKGAFIGSFFYVVKLTKKERKREKEKYNIIIKYI
jgi:hypothetical protein